MSETPNLDLTHLEENASSPEIRVNELADGLDHALNSSTTIDFSSDADLTLSTSGSVPQEWQYGFIKLTDTGANLTTGRNVIVPDNKKRTVFENDTAQTLTIKTSGGTGIALSAGSVSQLQCDGTNVVSADGGGGSFNLVDDSTPQLGGQLDVNGNAIGDGTDELLEFTETGSAVNHIGVENESTGNAPSVYAAGDDTNIDLNLKGKGAGQVMINDAYKLPNSDGTSGQALVTDGSGGVTFGNPSGSASVLDMPTLSKSSAYTVTTGDQGKLIEADANSAGFTITLPAAATAGDGFTIAVKKIDSSSNTVTIDGNGAETIDGATTATTSTQYDVYLLQCNGTSWNVFVKPAGAATDNNAIHDNQSGEIEALTEVDPVPGDWLIIEDTSDSDNKKKIDAEKLLTQSLIIPCSAETGDLAADTSVTTFRMPYAFTLTDVRASVNTAPTGSTIEVDINEGGVSILSTVISIDASEKTSTTAATAAVISDSVLADDAEITIDIDQVGSTIAGEGLKVTLIGYQS